MAHRRRVLGAIGLFLQAVLFSIVVLIHGGVPAGATGSIAITGTVTNQSGSGVANVSVTADTPGTTTVVYGPSTSASDGTYTLYVDAGTYDFHFDPPSGSMLNSYTDSNVAIAGNQTINAQLSPLTYTLSGAITDQNNNPIVDLEVSLVNGSNTVITNTYTDSSGGYSLSATPGSYHIDLGSFGASHVSNNMIISENGIGPQVDLSGGNVTQNMQLATATLHVTLTDNNGIPEPNYKIYGSGYGYVTPYQGGTFNLTTGTPQTITTDSNGHADVTTLVGMTYDAGLGGSGSELCANTTPTTCLTASLSVSADTNVSLVGPVRHIFSGTITNGSGVAAPGVEVDLLNNGTTYGSGTSDANGNFSVAATPQTYNLRLYVANGSSQISWLPNSSFSISQSGGSAIDLTSGNIIQNLSITTSQITVTVKDSSGNPLANAPVDSNPYGGVTYVAPTIPMTATAEATGRTDANGVVVLNVLKGAQYGQSSGANSTMDNLCANINSSEVCIYSPLTISGNTNVLIQPDVVPPTVTNLTLSKTSVRTGTTITITANASDALSGVKVGEFYVDSDPGAGNGTSMAYSNGQVSAQYTVNLSSGTHTVYVRAKDKAGNWSATISTTLQVR